ncbi:MAG: hypothetical protein ACYDC9_10385 [Dermatophilaceae bacterium]
MTRSVRAVALSIVSVVTAASVAGCGAAQAVLGIHEPPKANPASAPLTVDQAKRILTRDFTAAQQAEMATGAAAQAALRTAYTGEALRAAMARVKLAAIQPTAADSPLLVPQQPRLLAVPRGFGYPRVMVAQTVAAEGSLPILHLLTSPDAATPYRISASATMLPSSTVKPFDPLSQGSPLVTDGTGLAVSDTDLLKTYAEAMAFPAKVVTAPPFAADPFSSQVRAKAAAVSKAVAAQASFSQVHKVVPNSVYAVRQANGDALVFGVIERTDSFKVKEGQAVNTAGNQEFVLLTGKKLVTKSASITRLEFVVFTVPRSKGQATLVAVSDPVIAGSGS